MRAIDKLKAAADLSLRERTVTLGDGSEFVLWATNLTMAEREKAQKESRLEDANSFALQLLILKAKDENGSPLFAPGEAATFKRDCEDADVQKLMMCVLERAEGDLDTKRTGSVAGATESGSVAASAILGSKGTGVLAKQAKD